jgi:cephalosporin-C deacetylase
MTESTYCRPADFDDYWVAVKDELASTPARPEVEKIPIRETEFATLFGVRLSSIGPYRLFGYLSVPKASGPFPAIYWPPSYSSVLQIIPQGTESRIRSRFVTFSLAGRGQRNSDQPFAAMFPGLLIEGIESPDGYVFRGIVADALRGLEFLQSSEYVDTSSIVVVGNDVAMQAAALGGGASHLVCTPALFFDALALAGRSSAYPLEEYNDYLRFHPSHAEQVAHTLLHYDLRAFAPTVNAKTLIMAGPDGSAMGPAAMADLGEAIPGQADIYASQQSSFKDGLYTERWIASQLGFDDPIVPAHWR